MISIFIQRLMSFHYLALVSYATVPQGGRLSACGPTKTKMCRFHKIGKCEHGSECMLAHNESEIGDPRAGNAFMTYGHRPYEHVLLS